MMTSFAEPYHLAITLVRLAGLGSNRMPAWRLGIPLSMAEKGRAPGQAVRGANSIGETPFEDRDRFYRRPPVWPSLDVHDQVPHAIERLLETPKGGEIETGDCHGRVWVTARRAA